MLLVIGWLVGLFVCRVIRWVIWLVGLFVRWLVGRSVVVDGWLIGWFGLLDWLVGHFFCCWLVRLLVGLIGLLAVFLLIHQVYIWFVDCLIWCLVNELTYWAVVDRLIGYDWVVVDRLISYDWVVV